MPRHGTTAYYRNGCRCDKCRAAATEYNRRRYATEGYRYRVILDVATADGFSEIVETDTINQRYAMLEYGRALRRYGDTNDVLVRLEKVEKK